MTAARIAALLASLVACAGCGWTGTACSTGTVRWIAESPDPVLIGQPVEVFSRDLAYGSLHIEYERNGRRYRVSYSTEPSR
jgi:hypothetical protein